MSKITNDIKKEIAKTACVETFAKRVADWKKEDNKLAVECYNFIFPKKIRDTVALVPEGWLRKCSCLRFNANGWSVSLNAAKEMPTPDSNGCSNLGSITGELADKVQKHVEAKRTMDFDYNTALNKMNGFLAQFNTFKQIEKSWPEGKKFYQKYNADRPTSGLPAVITKEINEMLGLKVKP